MQYEIVKIACVCSCRNQHDDDRSVFRPLSIRFFYPCRNRPTIWRIAENTSPAPILQQAVLLLCEIFRRLVVRFIRTRIQIEMKFPIQFVEKLLRRRPLIRFTAEKPLVYHGLILLFSLNSPLRSVRRFRRNIPRHTLPTWRLRSNSNIKAGTEYLDSLS